jgi:hypothetical protein
MVAVDLRYRDCFSSFMFMCFYNKVIYDFSSDLFKIDDVFIDAILIEESRAINLQRGLSLLLQNL